MNKTRKSYIKFLCIKHRFIGHKSPNAISLVRTVFAIPEIVALDMFRQTFSIVTHERYIWVALVSVDGRFGCFVICKNIFNLMHLLINNNYKNFEDHSFVFTNRGKYQIVLCFEKQVFVRK